MTEKPNPDERARQIGERLGTTLLLFVPILLVFAYRWISGDDKTDLVQAFGNYGWAFYYLVIGSMILGVIKLIVYDFRE